MKDQALYDRLVSRIRIDEKTGCWLWTGPVRPSKWPQNRYGIMSAKKPNGKWGSLHTHRAMMIAVLGPLTREQCVCHRCDIPLCVNPEHLFIGTMGDNIRDSRAKNRHHEAQKTHCERGHPLFGDNLVISHQGGKKLEFDAYAKSASWDALDSAPDGQKSWRLRCLPEFAANLGKIDPLTAQQEMTRHED